MADSRVVPPRSDDKEELRRFFEQLSRIVNEAYGASVTNPPRLNITADTPPAPTGFVVTPGAGLFELQWDSLSYTGHSHTEIWRNGSNDLGTASIQGDSAVNRTTIVVSSQATYYFWIRHVNINGVAGPFSGSVSGAATSTAGFTITQLLGQLGYDHFQAGFFPIRNVDPLPTLPDTNYPINSVVALTSQGSRLYKNVANVWVDGVTEADIPAQWSVGSTQLVKDAVVAGKIAAGAIVADDGVIANAAIKDAQIANVSASKITGGTISATVIMTSPDIRGGVIQTTDGRLKITNNRLEVYDEFNRLRVRIGKLT